MGLVLITNAASWSQARFVLVLYPRCQLIEFPTLYFHFLFIDQNQVPFLPFWCVVGHG